MGNGNGADGPAVALVTALPVECAAARQMLDDPVERRVAGDPNHYVTGTVPSSDPRRPHRVVVALQARDGTRNAAAICTDLARSFPGLEVFLMCGIAAGVPGPSGMRLGDLVVATKGIVDYAHVRAVDGTATLRRHLDGLSTVLLRADREIQVAEHAGHERWRDALSERRPDDGDVTVHRGAIGSADILLRDAVLRDGLAARYDLCAFEMEGSGIAVGAELHDRRWFMVRGISDLADAAKADGWHRYASAVAAAYSRALLTVCAPTGRDAAPTGRDAAPTGRDAAPTGRDAAPLSAANGLETIVDALLGLRLFRDDHQRREVIDQLPDYIRSAVPDNPAARLHVLALVRTCEDFEDDGRDALVGAIRIALGSSSPEFRRVSDIVTANWPRPRR
ncbi:hypothetical protein KOI35_30690 [Actinoplanes bogorensis]|uniref:Nucleoside phosphorylase domain-containing protein n=1 Tax=Paractinoplanes bogorensis TaxID=1610840 RepID=A0ABS5YWS5_9ACTN|nr:hypothetical protein [Actinoplanes bogorensis]MBU2667888.1 hypothetical protein [Actinoplanes bogorensis]